MADEGLYTFVQLYNASGDTLYFDGSFTEFPYPKQIGNGDSAWFVHTSADSTDSDIIVYRFNGDQLIWALGWENSLNSQNKLGTEIQPLSVALRDNRAVSKIN
ncbi:hypothetical protein FEM48_Zijuj10G0000800 [Ziziphus jujuba var. spinosa]|uniref:Uncharacterized protein n=1 Tax=Ziziphus jujuba var. spinosa TaxID=714518 RepID=A0A978UK38_ZIZJJ|nr:hypothetical protein FEM48_Zijuj10G0000800 [Ziziphus jujuba var. spinosa]